MISVAAHPERQGRRPRRIEHAARTLRSPSPPAPHGRSPRRRGWAGTLLLRGNSSGVPQPKQATLRATANRRARLVVRETSAISLIRRAGVAGGRQIRYAPALVRLLGAAFGWRRAGACNAHRRLSAHPRRHAPGRDACAAPSRADTIYGEMGNDKLFGLGGDDAIDGGFGADKHARRRRQRHADRRHRRGQDVRRSRQRHARSAARPATTSTAATATTSSTAATASTTSTAAPATTSSSSRASATTRSSTAAPATTTSTRTAAPTARCSAARATTSSTAATATTRSTAAPATT